MWEIYGLIDPGNWSVRYVGVTCMGMDARLKKHLLDKTDTYKGKWIRHLLSQKQHPRTIRLQTCSTKTEAYQAEVEWIALGTVLGWKLANGTPGGCGGDGGRDVSFKISQVRTQGRLTKEIEEDVCRSYPAMNTHELGRKYGFNHQVILNILRRNGIARQTNSEAQRHRVATPETRAKMRASRLRYLSLQTPS